MTRRAGARVPIGCDHVRPTRLACPAATAGGGGYEVQARIAHRFAAAARPANELATHRAAIDPQPSDATSASPPTRHRALATEEAH